jgi:hypothetical protein
MPKVFTWLLLAVLLLNGCTPAGEPAGYPQPAATAQSPSDNAHVATLQALAVDTPTPGMQQSPPSQATLSPTATFTPDSGWETLRTGLERRVLNLLNEQGKRYERIYILRMDPAAFQFAVAYHPQPQGLEVWQKETGALIVVNGGYYRQEGESDLPTGLAVINGQVMGASYGSFAGMFAVGSQGPDLRWLEQTPYDPAEALQSALQSFPLLVKPGGELGFPASAEDNQPARRTVIARDRQGRFLLILAPLGYFTLHQISAWLTESDLELDIALNLDGGPSTGLLLADPAEQIPAYSDLPIVITISPR